MNKKYLIFSLPILAILLVSAATLYYSVTQEVTVEAGYVLTGDVDETDDIFAGQFITFEDLNVKSQTSVNVPLSILTTSDPVDTENIVSTIIYLLDNSAEEAGATCGGYPDDGWRDKCEKRIDFDGMPLSEFTSMSWDVNVIGGYVSHVDLVLDNGESLTFEYATFDSDCNVPSSYPEGEYVFNVDIETYAWESIPGPCGDVDFEAQHNTLDEWKATYLDATILKIEIEADNWIEASNSEISNVKINGEDVSGKPFLLPGSELNFDIVTKFDVGIVNDTYTLTTKVTTR